MKRITFNLLSNTFSDCSGQICSGVRKNDYEFITAVTGHSVGVADRGENHCGHFHQNVGTNEVSVLIVDAFEIVEIEEECCDTCSVATCSPDFVQQKLTQVPSVMKFC